VVGLGGVGTDRAADRRVPR